MKMRVWKQCTAMLLTLCLTAAQLPFALGAQGTSGQNYQGELSPSGDGKTGVKVTLQYQYSSTGGMVGINAHAPETVEFFLNEDGTTAPAAWSIPHFDAAVSSYHGHDHENLRGFRVVLDPAPLNAFLVDPPTGTETPKELEEKLDRGDFDVDQEKLRKAMEEDPEAETKAWIAGRSYVDEATGLEFQVVDKNSHAAHGSDALEGPQLIVKNPQRLQNVTPGTEITLTVNYRRDNGTYTVKHYTPKEGVLEPDVNAAEDWTEHESEALSGRVGAMTRAEAMFIPGFMNLAVSQQPIAADGSTVVSIYYKQDRKIRVVFDTSDCEGKTPARQTVEIGKAVEFNDTLTPDPTKEGYIFEGWGYQPKGGGELILVTDAKQYDPDAKTLTLDEKFLTQADCRPSEETAGMNVLRLYPKWTLGKTSVRVVFWTEDLTGTDDVDCREKDEPGSLKVQTHAFDDPDGAAYSNMGFYTLTNVQTNCELAVDTDAGTLNYTAADDGLADALDLRTVMAGLETMKIQTSYEGPDETYALEHAADFYALSGYRVTQMEGAPKESRDGDQAANTGTTVVNVYYTRKIYQLEFIYGEEIDGKPYLGKDTWGYANGHVGNSDDNTLCEVEDGQENLVPKPLVITAKYGADLRNDWPFRSDLTVKTKAVFDQWWKGNQFSFVSWTTTAGPYNAQARYKHQQDRRSGEPTLMGVYGAMGADIIADPNDESKVHLLYGYWSEFNANNHYRYNHCYEVPGVTPELLKKQEGLETLALDEQSESNESNVCYLLPAEGEGEVLDIIRGYGFDDLKKVSYATGQSSSDIQIDEKNGNYYGFRIYQGKCYALARMVSVVSTNTIGSQNPSARLHMRRVNIVPDHSTLYQDGQGVASMVDTVGSATAPYELFFYYDRASYTVLYSVGSERGVAKLGTKTLYYGAKLSDAYNITLESGASKNGVRSVVYNGRYAVSPENPDGWTLTAEGGEVNVCPDRNLDGTKEWSFRGWSMDLAGTALLDSPEDWQGVVSGDLHLYAQWEAPKYTVEFDWNGGHLAFGRDEDYKVQQISANSSIIFGGMAPTPVRSGYSLEGWNVTHRDLSGEREWTAVEPVEEFHLEDLLSASVKLRARWERISDAEEFTYTVRHVLDDDQNVRVAPDQTLTGSFVRGAWIWAIPIQTREYEGQDRSNYIPTVQNAGVLVPLDGVDVDPIMIPYRPPTPRDAYSYMIRFTDGEGKEVYREELKAAEAVKTVYAGRFEDVLEEKGYWLADEDGNRIDLKSDTLLKTLTQDGETEAVFPVVAQTYEIEYQWPDGMDEAVKTELSSKLPQSYTPAKGATPLPALSSYQQGEQRQYFKGWKLTRGTLNGESNVERSSVTIAPESRGALTFAALWGDAPATKPSNPGSNTGSNPGDTGGTVKPEDLLERDKHDAYILGRPGGKMAPEAPITRAEVVTMFYRLFTEESRSRYETAENPFTDVSGNEWFFRPAVTLAKAGIVEGLPGGRFAPEANITRGEFAALSARFLSKTYVGESHFSDIEGHWAAEYVDRAAQQGWIKGYPDGTFRPDAYITRAEAITLTNAVLGREPHKDGLLDNLIVWSDNADTSKWYYLDIQEATISHKYEWQTVDGKRVERWTETVGGGIS